MSRFVNQSHTRMGEKQRKIQILAEKNSREFHPPQIEL